MNNHIRNIPSLKKKEKDYTQLAIRHLETIFASCTFYVVLKVVGNCW